MQAISDIGVRLAAVIGAASLLFGAASASAQEYTWRMATTAPQSSANYSIYALTFVENVEQMTGGRVEIQPFPADVIAPAFGVHDAVQDGLAELGQTVPAYIVNKDPANILLSGQPGGMGPEAYYHWLYGGGGKELWVEFRREEMGLHPLIAGLGTSEIFAHAHKPIRTAADLAGLKFRTIGSWAQIIEGFGAAPVVVPGHEVYTMLERKALDAAEWSTPSGNEKAGLNKIAEYIVVPGVHSPSYAFEVIMKKELWDSLPADLQTQLEAAAQLTSFQTYIEWDMADLEAWNILREGRNEIVTLDPAFIAEVKQAGRKWALEQAAEQAKQGNHWAERIGESYFAFQDLWETTAPALNH